MKYRLHLVGFLFITALIASGVVVAQSKPVTSPRARQLRDQTRTTVGTDEDMLDRSVKSVSPRVGAHRRSLQRTGTSTADALIRTTGLYAPKLVEKNPAEAAPTRK